MTPAPEYEVTRGRMIALARSLRCVNCDTGFELTPSPVATTRCPHCGSEHLLPIEGNYFLDKRGELIYSRRASED